MTRDELLAARRLYRHWLRLGLNQDFGDWIDDCITVYPVGYQVRKPIPAVNQIPAYMGKAGRSRRKEVQDQKERK